MLLKLHLQDKGEVNNKAYLQPLIWKGAPSPQQGPEIFMWAWFYVNTGVFIHQNHLVPGLLAN